MRTRSMKLGAIGASLGLVLMASAIAPAYAASPVPSALTNPASCSDFKGGTATGPSFGVSGVSLQAGETITTTVSPGRTSDSIFLSASIGLNIILAEGPTTGFTFTAPATAVYNLTWSYKTASTVPTGLTWTFDATCSSTTVSPTPTTPTKPGKGGGKHK